ncbi:hypothetical protein GCK72_014641 [Caenorhabditis remanei]|uniref:CRE-PRDX-6 protein n=2 Tax=Caenorhabditis remanei TaxID=31234 RepID=E3M701_CAERE|nr:hypothetical protein GCK72_014641 [Caenorhabditis remanei]EFO92986.1 CRE-PRDX-6 protein [Caenorhabditis remanei]KAF1758183.1 hypothetical protein GCK72_014641 [Caenorhabditis remanei]
MKLGDTVPNFTFETNLRKNQNLHSYIGDNWLMLFSHPADFTPVCTTELAELVRLAPEFNKRHVEILAISIDSSETHRDWAKDINALVTGCFNGGNNLPFEIIADTDRKICTELGMIDPDEQNSQGICLSARAVMLFGPDRKLKSKILYPATFGRNFVEILRMVDGVQLGTKAPVATPVNWISGDNVIAQPSLSQERVINELCGGDPNKCKVVPLPSGKRYLRVIVGDAYLQN